MHHLPVYAVSRIYYSYKIISKSTAVFYKFNVANSASSPLTKQNGEALTCFHLVILSPKVEVEPFLSFL